MLVELEHLRPASPHFHQRLLLSFAAPARFFASLSADYIRLFGTRTSTAAALPVPRATRSAAHLKRDLFLLLLLLMLFEVIKVIVILVCASTRRRRFS